ncbi:MAG: type II toxin-antitoxin system YoeB family toxin [Pseudobutyrivibrio sp.]|nr:type II toxin-antitoxin system YoeB family toxin [Pseudobutyrivibrio sp.]
MSEKIWFDDAWKDYLYWQTQDKKTLKRINQLVKDIERNGVMHGIGEPEPLKVNLLVQSQASGTVSSSER